MTAAGLSVTWWGHAGVTVECDGVRVLTDPLLVDRLAHLRRQAPSVPGDARRADVVLVSHLHADHLHVGSLRQVDPRATLVVPRGAATLLVSLPHRVVEVAPGEQVTVGDVEVQVLPASHDDRRHPASSLRASAVGFRFTVGGRSVWFPGDTGPRADHADLQPVNLGLVPVGGWGPSLGDGHLTPEQAADATRAVGCRWVLPVHHGTLWPMGLRHLDPAGFRRWFTEPAPRFATLLADDDVEVVRARHNTPVVLGVGDDE
ncbi:MBL fold metallo-hydrolase [Aeromicrobium halocynthiae]|uniref:MBL fold metallo-hydrolase n=1 Tax=Aeromicrobium halocynthiae TaxID=560557 RepID=A0ABN2W163_9ACTN